MMEKNANGDYSSKDNSQSYTTNDKNMILDLLECNLNILKNDIICKDLIYCRHKTKFYGEDCVSRIKVVHSKFTLSIDDLVSGMIGKIKRDINYYEEISGKDILLLYSNYDLGRSNNIEEQIDPKKKGLNVIDIKIFPGDYSISQFQKSFFYMASNIYRISYYNE